MRRVSAISINGSFFVFALVVASVFSGPDTANAFPKQMPAQAVASAALSGTVVETMNAGGYTYICLEKEKQKTWVAVPSMEAKVGEELSVHPGNQMGPFTSKFLNRTFDKIIFSGGVVTSAVPTETQTPPAAMPSGHPEIPAAAATLPIGHSSVPAADGGAQASAAGTVKVSGKVLETFDAGGYTYVRLEKDGQASWAAVPPVKVKVGDEVGVKPGMEMGQFTSKTLNRTFDNIIFAPGLVIN